MKAVLALATLLLTTQSFAATQPLDGAIKTGAEVMLRQIADSKHFGRDALRAVKVALEGSKGKSLSAFVRNMDCEPALGSDDCIISLQVTDSSQPPKFQDLSFDIQTRVHQGKVIAGKPVDIEN